MSSHGPRAQEEAVPRSVDLIPPSGTPATTGPGGRARTAEHTLPAQAAAPAVQRDPRGPATDVPAVPAPVTIGQARVHPVTRSEAARAVVAWASAGSPALVVTPNVDHLVLLERDDAFRDAYASATLQVCDGMPVLVLGRLSGSPLPERVTGADLFLDVCALAAERGLRIFIAGGMPDVLERGISVLRERFPHLEVSGHSPPRGFEGTAAEDTLRSRIAAADPHVVMVCFGAPRQEVWAAAQCRRQPGVYMCVGAAIDFAAGAKRRAPRWMQQSGLEWFHRLLQEPGRLGQRYLVQDRAFFGIALRQLRKHTR